METIPALLEALKKRGIRVFLAGDVLKYSGQKNSFSPSEKARVAKKRGAIISYLKACETGARGPVEHSGESPEPSLSQEMLWNWVLRPRKSFPQEQIQLIKSYRDITLQMADTAIRTIVARHDTLRSSFKQRGNNLHLEFNKVEAFRIEMANLGRTRDRSLLPDQVNEKLKVFTNVHVPIDGSWLTHAQIISTGRSEIIVVLTFNHIIFDGVSRQLIAAELDGLLIPGASKVLSDGGRGRVDYADFARWERTWFGGPAGATLIEYWRSWLSARPVLVVPTRGLALEWRPGSGSTMIFSIRSCYLDNLYSRARELSATMPQLLLAIFGIAIAKWSGRHSFPIRNVADARTEPELRSLVGYMVCIDVIDFYAPSDYDLQTVVHSLLVEWYSAYRTRLPTPAFGFPRHKAFPDIGHIEFSTKIAITFNYVSIRSRASRLEAHQLGTARHSHLWPPKVVRTQSGDPTQLLHPICLRLFETDSRLICRITFNENILLPNEQTAILGAFLAEIGKCIT